ncbi:hypothetical protein CNMCM7691_001060 [Aspergillus felis]|uniref:Uncharacterized protein n=1 Tax=Aspergillus felis TaxID=1287682 RepID=A0A8H6QZ78_9EURO|nr:hypothetical protein CNMCM7691_001060 [Aspergillus felis]
MDTGASTPSPIPRSVFWPHGSITVINEQRASRPGVLVPVFGLLLDLPWFRSCPRALIASNFLLALAHLQFISRVAPILPLCLLGIAFELYGVAFWAAVAQTLVFTVQSWPNQNSNNSDSSREFVREGGYESIRSSTDSEDAQGESSDLADSIHEGHEKAIMTLGFGVMTSLLNASTAVVPILLAETEGMAGFDGLERVFLVLAVLGYLASVRLAWIWKIS